MAHSAAQCMASLKSTLPSSASMRSCDTPAAAVRTKFPRADHFAAEKETPVNSGWELILPWISSSRGRGRMWESQSGR
jgi:hypothetical protein